MLNKVKKGELIKMNEIMKDVGYSPATCKHPEKVTETKTYKENAPRLIEGIAPEIERIKRAMARKNLDNEEYKVLVASLDVLTKNHQLLSGAATERRVFVIPSEVIGRNDIDTSQPLLENGSTEPSNDAT